MSYLRLCGVDPGFANLGFCIVDLYATGGSAVVDTRLVVTTPKKGKASDLKDEKRRLEEIEDAFLEFIELHKPHVLAIEEPSKCLMKRFNPKTKKHEWVTNAARLRSSCQAWGAVHGICRAKGIYCIEVGSQDIKKTLCNKKSASKTEIIKTVKSRYPNYRAWPTSKKVEHVADAVGAAITSFNDPAVMVMLRKLRAEL